MKLIYYKSISFFLLMLLCLTSCADKQPQKDIWEAATYTEDTTLGEGATTVYVEVEAEDKSLLFTVHTDETKLGAALLGCELISGEEGAYGLYVKNVNGITADYDTDKAYWAVTKSGEQVMSGVDGITIADGEQYEFVYTKQ